MNCKSCNNEVPSKFTHAIQTNVCPFCGQEIMALELWKVLKELGQLMKEAEPFMDEVKHWLASNYSIGKSLSASKTASSESSSSPNENTPLIVEDDFDATFLSKEIAKAKQKTASSIPKTIPKIQDAKSLVKKIQNAGLDEFVGTDPDYGEVDMTKDQGPPLSSNEAQQMAEMFESSYARSNLVLEKAMEMEKIKKLHTSNQTNDGPRFSRRE